MTVTQLQLLVGAAVVVIGWFATYALKRREAAALRDERTADLERALLAEIRAHQHQLARWRDEGGGADTVAAILAGADRGPGAFIPILPAERHDRVYASTLAEIHMLSSGTIRPVVTYYNQIAVLADMADMIRSPAFAEVSAERRAIAYTHYIALKHAAAELGQVAADALEAALKPKYVFSS
jgi:hypothetical protein